MLTMKINTNRSVVLERTFHVGVFVGERETNFQERWSEKGDEMYKFEQVARSSLIFHDVFNVSEHER